MEDSAEVEVPIGVYRLKVATGFGPRVTGFRRVGGNEMFVRLEGVVIEHPDSGTYHLRGGHRLWAAPEIPAVTYAADDDPCEVEIGECSCRVKGPVDRAGLAKEIVLAEAPIGVEVTHSITNHNLHGVQIAAWAITQFPLGGTALLTLGGREGVFRADRYLVTWPYTSFEDPRLTWVDGGVQIRAEAGPRLKLGAGPRPGRIGYLNQGWLFMKHIKDATGLDYPDFGAVGQVFCDDASCELESVGPLVELAPGASTIHRETWSLWPCDEMSKVWERLRGEE